MLSKFGFEAQAAHFDDRTGLPDAVQAAVACAVSAHCASAGAVLEIGAGTGQIGQHLARQLGPRYVGLDASRAMLARFRERAPQAALVLADASAPWPVAGQRFSVVFMSRVLHLLDHAHVATQLRHTLAASGSLLVGRREREDTSVHSLLRRELQRALRSLGYAPRRSQRAARPGDVVAEWTCGVSAAQLLESWRGKPGLCGIDVLEAHKRELLARLEQYALAQLGSLTREHEHRERYTLSCTHANGG